MLYVVERTKGLCVMRNHLNISVNRSWVEAYPGELVDVLSPGQTMALIVQIEFYAKFAELRYGPDTIASNRITFHNVDDYVDLDFGQNGFIIGVREWE